MAVTVKTCALLHACLSWSLWLSGKVSRLIARFRRQTVTVEASVGYGVGNFAVVDVECVLDFRAVPETVFEY